MALPLSSFLRDILLNNTESSDEFSQAKVIVDNPITFSPVVKRLDSNDLPSSAPPNPKKSRTVKRVSWPALLCDKIIPPPSPEYYTMRTTRSWSSISHYCGDSRSQQEEEGESRWMPSKSSNTSASSSTHHQHQRPKRGGRCPPRLPVRQDSLDFDDECDDIIITLD